MRRKRKWEGRPTVCHVCCLVYVGAWVDPLAGWFFKRAAAPCGCDNAEVSVCAGGERRDCEEGGGQHGCECGWEKIPQPGSGVEVETRR
jgi:hypothetical protein